jgi:hypothetical protein
MQWRRWDLANPIRSRGESSRGSERNASTVRIANGETTSLAVTEWIRASLALALSNVDCYCNSPSLALSNVDCYCNSPSLALSNVDCYCNSPSLALT